MTSNIISFNPLDKKNLGASVAEAMLASKVHPLGDIPAFRGIGIYAIYYSGKFDTYAEIVKRNKDGKFCAPIYVGKTVPAGARKGGGSGDENSGKPLFKRLAEHADSIKAASNLDVLDFHCRFLTVDDIWIPLSESLLIARYSPAWNTLVDGFGNHDPGRGRYEGLRPRWDVLHPGRSWAEKCKPRLETAADIDREVAAFLRGFTFPASERFIEAGN